MATIDQLLGNGGQGRGISSESGVDTLVALFNAVVDDLQANVTNLTALMIKLDGEAQLGGGYVTAHTPAALTLVKGS
jgi:hypothetical protein